MSRKRVPLRTCPVILQLRLREEVPGRHVRTLVDDAVAHCLVYLHERPVVRRVCRDGFLHLVEGKVRWGWSTGSTSDGELTQRVHRREVWLRWPA